MSVREEGILDTIEREHDHLVELLRRMESQQWHHQPDRSWGFRLYQNVARAASLTGYAEQTRVMATSEPVGPKR